MMIVLLVMIVIGIDDGEVLCEMEPMEVLR